MYKSFIINTCLVLIISIGVISCKNKQNTENEALLKNVIGDNIGKKLLIPEDLKMYKPFPNYIADSISITEAKFKIYTHINVSCSTCIEDIKLWNDLIPKFDKFNVPVVLICDSKDNFELIKYLCESRKINSFPFPFFLDKNNEYLKKNEFMSKSIHFETVFTDEEDKIILMGNPIHSKEILELYINEMKKRITINSKVLLVEGVLIE